MGIFKSSAETTVVPHERAEMRAIDRKNMVMLLIMMMMMMMTLSSYENTRISFCFV
jgi:hypothetical protein